MMTRESPTPIEKKILAALKSFAATVTDKMTSLTAGEPEDQLRAPFEGLMAELGEVIARKLVCTGETLLPGRLGKPDYAVHSSGTLAGYVELKAPGKGANPNAYRGHDYEQWKRFRDMPNLIYTDGNEWAVYRSGKRDRGIVRLAGDVAADGRKAVEDEDGPRLLGLLTDFLSWVPRIPTDRKGHLDLPGFAGMLAPLCRMLRDDVTDALRDPVSPLKELARDWRDLLFPGAGDEQFADAYAQTVTFALLLGRSEGADPLTLESAEAALAAEHSLLARALQVLTDTKARAEISASVNLLVRVISDLAPAGLGKAYQRHLWLLTGPKEPWLYFYEDFLGAYDPKLRKDAGVYYTPVEVVCAQVRLIEDLLRNRLGKPLGFADDAVVTLDPAVGTGTYLLGVIEHALYRAQAQEGAGSVPGKATTLAGNIYGFEIMVGPFAVAELRVSRALHDKGARLPHGGTQIYLTDTLESPNTPPRVLPFYLRPIEQQHSRALKVKAQVPVIVCLGNPPYDRHAAVQPGDEGTIGKCGGWVRFGEPLVEQSARGRGKDGAEPNGPAKKRRSQQAILKEREKLSILYSGFVRPAVEAGHGVDVKNLYNLYVYFWRWALWKVFESKNAPGPGIASFISASSYLDGDAFCGMREHMRRLCDEIWIIDLGGEGRGTRKSENVFAIQTPVAIAIAFRSHQSDKSSPARAHYARIEGTRDEKLKALNAVADFRSLEWDDCPDGWHAPFRPAGAGRYFGWPLLTDLLPWQHSGVQLKRTWPIAPDKDTLERRWRALLTAEDKSTAFHGTGDREVDGAYRVKLTAAPDFAPIASLPNTAPMAPAVRFAYRSFDRQYVIADGRLMSRPRPDLWAAHGDMQVCLTTSFTQPIGAGPAVMCCAHMPDLHSFNGRGAKDIVPLLRDPKAKEANILPGLLDVLADAYARKVSPVDFLAYVYGVLAQPAFTKRYADALSTRELRVPLTKDADLFEKARRCGAKLLWLHTYGERFVPKGEPKGQVPQGKARCTVSVPGDAENYPEDYAYTEETKTLHVGKGEFAPVDPEAYGFEVSGLKVVQSWLGYRMKKPKGKKSSPLDQITPERWTSEFTSELLALLWVLEATLAEYPAQAELLSDVVRAPCFKPDELPPVPDAARRPPPRAAPKRLFGEEHPDDG